MMMLMIMIHWHDVGNDAGYVGGGDNSGNGWDDDDSCCWWWFYWTNQEICYGGDGSGADDWFIQGKKTDAIKQIKTKKWWWWRR